MSDLNPASKIEGVALTLQFAPDGAHMGAGGTYYVKLPSGDVLERHQGWHNPDAETLALMAEVEQRYLRAMHDLEGLDPDA